MTLKDAENVICGMDHVMALVSLNSPVDDHRAHGHDRACKRTHKLAVVACIRQEREPGAL